MHHSKLAGFIIDCQTSDLPAAAQFWGAALGMEVRALPADEGEKYVRLVDPQARLHIEVQAVEHESRVHLDVETDDIEAEVRRLEGLGAKVVKRVHTWTVMQAPTGQRFCVVRQQSVDFALTAKRWGESKVAAPVARPPSIVNLAAFEPQPLVPGLAPTGAAAQRFEARVASISAHTGAKKLGYNLTVIPPGKRAFPFHHHRVNEELFLILEGRGEVRIGAQTHQVGPGDLVACPPGGPENAHQFHNSGSTDLKYLAISTMEYPEVVGYPDSGKFGVRAALEQSEGGGNLRFVGRLEQGLDYWDGE